MRIGVGVEGASDRVFWDKVLRKHFSGVHFDIRNMKSREKLIRQTPRLLEAFRSLRYTAGFVLMDRERDPCTAAAIEQFDSVIREAVQRPLNERYLFICLAVRGLEAWFLADASAVNTLLPRAGYLAPPETADLNPKQVLSELWKKQFGQYSAPNKIRFAQMLAPKFDPVSARRRSASFDYFWTRVTTALQS